MEQYSLLIIIIIIINNLCVCFIIVGWGADWEWTNWALGAALGTAGHGRSEANPLLYRCAALCGALRSRESPRTRRLISERCDAIANWLRGVAVAGSSDRSLAGRRRANMHKVMGTLYEYCTVHLHAPECVVKLGNPLRCCRSADANSRIEMQCIVLFEVLIIAKFARKHRVNKGAIREWLALSNATWSPRAARLRGPRMLLWVRREPTRGKEYSVCDVQEAGRTPVYARRVVSGSETLAEGEAQNGREVRWWQFAARVRLTRDLWATRDCVCGCVCASDGVCLHEERVHSAELRRLVFSVLRRGAKRKTPATLLTTDEDWVMSATHAERTHAATRERDSQNAPLMYVCTIRDVPHNTTTQLVTARIRHQIERWEHSSPRGGTNLRAANASGCDCEAKWRGAAVNWMGRSSAIIAVITFGARANLILRRFGRPSALTHTHTPSKRERKKELEARTRSRGARRSSSGRPGGRGVGGKGERRSLGAAVEESKGFDSTGVIRSRGRGAQTSASVEFRARSSWLWRTRSRNARTRAHSSNLGASGACDSEWTWNEAKRRLKVTALSPSCRRALPQLQGSNEKLESGPMADSVSRELLTLGTLASNQH